MTNYCKEGTSVSGSSDAGKLQADLAAADTVVHCTGNIRFNAFRSNVSFKIKSESAEALKSNAVLDLDLYPYILSGITGYVFHLQCHFGGLVYSLPQRICCRSGYAHECRHQAQQDGNKSV